MNLPVLYWDGRQGFFALNRSRNQFVFVMAYNKNLGVPGHKLKAHDMATERECDPDTLVHHQELPENCPEYTVIDLGSKDG